MAYIFVTTKEKTNWKYILIIVILALIVVAETFYLLKQEEKISETKLPPKSTQDETANWKTYGNENFGIEFKYPRNWVISREDETLVTFQNADKPSQGISILKSSGPPPETMGYKLIERKAVFIDKLELSRELFQGIQSKFGDWRDRYYVRVFIQEKAIFYQGDFKKDDLEEFLPLFNQMLSTFRFLE